MTPTRQGRQLQNLAILSLFFFSWLSMITLPALPYGIPFIWCATCYWAYHHGGALLIIFLLFLGFFFDATQNVAFGTWGMMLALAYFLSSRLAIALVGRPFWISWVAIIPALMAGGMIGWLLTFLSHSAAVSAGPMMVNMITAFALYPLVSAILSYLTRRFVSGGHEG